MRVEQLNLDRRGPSAGRCRSGAPKSTPSGGARWPRSWRPPIAASSRCGAATAWLRLAARRSALPTRCPRDCCGWNSRWARRSPTPTSPATFPARRACSAQRPTCSACVPKVRATSGPGWTTASGQSSSRCATRARDLQPAGPRTHGEYPFVQVEGDGVHEIPVGPVHAGIIEPGHFRFSIVGEKVLRLEERLGYVHKGIERRFTELPPLEAHRLAGRVSGDSTVAFAWAYCMALESALGVAIPAARVMAARADARARARRQPPGRPRRHRQRRRAGVRAGAVLAPARRLAARVDAELRAPADDGRRRAGRRRASTSTPRRCRAPARAVRARGSRGAHAANDLRRARRAAGPLDRHRPRDARAGATRWASRVWRDASSGQACRPALRPQRGRPTMACAMAKATSNQGDVAARVAVRFDEVLESLRLIRALATELPAGAVRADLALPAGSARGAGWVEGWRGEVFVALELHARRDRTLPLPRPVVAELAAAGARGDRQHRSGLPADQQVVQPELFGARTSRCCKLMQQIARIGMCTEAPPDIAGLEPHASTIHDEILAILGQALAIRQVDAGSCNGCELEIHALNNPYYNLEGLGIRVRRQPAPCRHAAGHRPGVRATWSWRCAAPTTPRPRPSWWSRSATAAAPAASSARDMPAAAASPT